MRVERALAARVRGGEHAAQRTGAGEEHTDALHGRDLPHVREAGFALDDGPVHELALWVERPEIGSLLVLFFRHGPQRGRGADVVRPGATFRFEAHRGQTGPHLVGALDADEHDPAHAQIELPADALGGERWVRRDQVRLDDERVMQSGRRRPVDGAGVANAFHELGENRERSVEIAFHAAVEQVIGELVAECVLRQLRQCSCRRSVGGRRAAAATITRRIHAKDRFFLLEQLDHGIQSRTALVDAQGAHHRGGGDRQHPAIAHVADLLHVEWSAVESYGA